MTTDSGMDVSPSWQDLKEERDHLEHCYHLLASEMVYEGNSVQHWQQKARAYKECAGAVYDLKQIMGAETPAEVVKAVQALAAHAERLTALLLELDDTMPVTPHMPMAKIKGEYLERVEAAIQESTATSLARLKAEWQAEALEEWAEAHLGWAKIDARTVGAKEMRRAAIDFAEKLRHQHKEPHP